MQKVKVELGKLKSYEIVIGDNIISEIASRIKALRLGNSVVVITNPAIYSLHKKLIQRGFKRKQFNVTTIKIPDSEKSKSNREVIKLVETLVKIDKGKGLFIVAFGGGVVGDVAGFVASIYKRGIPYIQIPTTLLAQVDSAIGGKVAIDLSLAKNLVGAFYQPKIVISDISLLKSLPLRQIKSGLAEIIKYGIIEDWRLFDFLEKNIDKILKYNKDCLEYIIYRSSSIKAKIVALDEFDKKSIRVSLNYGHTIGHAIEAASKYSKAFSHGEAVAIGMICNAKIAVHKGLLKKTDAEKIIGLIKKTGLPTGIPKKLNIEKIMKAQAHDKKVLRGVNRFILPVKIGRVKTIENIPQKLIYEVIKSLKR